ncbi:Phosphoribosyl-AMP cyclohydrolase [Candidatus Magnetomorum sp. HK-1]|nr:Phosphoribosyl-AMP cyclohydrolase [Candidatus Magnetomorum sp. HK-1]
MIQLDFNKLNGLVPAIVQEYKTGDVLMLAFMNSEAWEATLKTGKATFWSRSRQELWVKGLTSGHIQLVKEISVDCDNDTVLLKVEQVGDIACHTGKRSCFFQNVEFKASE